MSTLEIINTEMRTGAGEENEVRPSVLEARYAADSTGHDLEPNLYIVKTWDSANVVAG